MAKKLSSLASEARKLFPGADPITRLSKDMKDAAKLMGLMEARYLVDAYYQYQNVRIRAKHQVDRCGDANEPTELLRWAHGNFDQIESDVKRSLGVFAAEYAVGEWLQSICGIAEVMSAGFLTTFDIRERLVSKCVCTDKDQDKKHGDHRRSMRPIGGSADGAVLRFQCTGRKGKGEKEHDKTDEPVSKDTSCKVVREIHVNDLTAGDVLIRPTTVGHFWNYAGLNPTIKWEKGTVRPWNARAKVLCFKAGESFIKVKNNDNDFYGKLYDARRQKEEAKNQAGDYKETALACAESVGKKTIAYKSYSQGKLPPAHLVARARRYAVKMFLSHLHDVMYRDYYGEAPPVPFVFSKHYKGEERHTHYIEPPYIDSSGRDLRAMYGEIDG